MGHCFCRQWLPLFMSKLLPFSHFARRAGGPVNDHLTRNKLNALINQEISQLHEFFAGWLSGRLPAETATFDRFSQVMADTFTIVNPAGAEIALPALSQGLKAAWGRQPGLHIRIKAVKLLDSEAGLVVARYQEWQQSTALESGRISTVVFRRAPATPNGLLWLRVHETWLAPAK
jgi:hypothetical protein